MRPASTQKAEEMIREMPFGVWTDTKSLAKNAKLSVKTMARFLIMAKKLGYVENKLVFVHSFKVSVWKRVA